MKFRTALRRLRLWWGHLLCRQCLGRGVLEVEHRECISDLEVVKTPLGVSMRHILSLRGHRLERYKKVTSWRNMASNYTVFVMVEELPCTCWWGRRKH